MILGKTNTFIVLLVFTGSCSQDFNKDITASELLGVQDGNGGGVLYCKVSDNQYTAQLLDYVEAEVRWPSLKLDLGSSDLDELAMAKVAIERIKRVDEHRYQIYSTFLKTFMNEVNFLSKEGFKIKSVYDTGFLPVIPDNCNIRQIAIQRQRQFDEDKRYIIDKKLWDILSVEHKSGLILHEIVYRDALMRGHNDSSAVRYLTALVSSKKLEEMEPTKFHLFLTKNNLYHFRYDKYTFLTTQTAKSVSAAISVCRNNDMKLAQVSGAYFRQNKFQETDLYSWLESNVFWASNTNTTYDKSGRLITINHTFDEIQMSSTYEQTEYEHPVLCEKVYF